MAMGAYRGPIVTRGAAAPPRAVWYTRPGYGLARSIVVAAVAAMAVATLSGCATVRSYEREILADPIMERQDFFAKQSLEQKFFSTREGSIGGAAGIGGGCGCAK